MYRYCIRLLQVAAMVLLPCVVFSQTSGLVKRTVTDKVELMVPVQLQEMTQEKWKIKYNTPKRPVVVLTDADAEVNLLIDTTAQPADEDFLEEYKNFRKDNLTKTRKDVAFLQDGIATANGKKMAFIKFWSQVADTRIFNYYFFAVAKGKIVAFTFNCIEKLKPTWEKLADDMLASVKTY